MEKVNHNLFLLRLEWLWQFGRGYDVREFLDADDFKDLFRYEDLPAYEKVLAFFQSLEEEGYLYDGDGRGSAAYLATELCDMMKRKEQRLASV